MSPETPILTPMPQTLDELARSQIKKWLDSTQTTQTHLADRIGKNQAWMSRYLNAEYDADLETLQSMAAVFSHSLAALLELPGDPEEAAVIAAYRALPTHARGLALELLQDWSRARARGRGRSRR